MATRRTKALKVLVLYKRSSLLNLRKDPSSKALISRFLKNHACHYESLRLVEGVLRDAGVFFRKHIRSRSVDYSWADLIVTVGGDGTFLEAARKASLTQVILGVNSDPSWSVGQFCVCDAKSFARHLQIFIDGRSAIKKLYKLKLSLIKAKKEFECLNDVLLCHANPAAMSRYEIVLNARKEDHRSSGLWVATAAGSTGAVLSAGGKKLPLESRALQYRPRELYHTPHVAYRLKGGMVASGERLHISSRMAKGLIFIDGAHIRLPFPYGEKAVIRVSSRYISMVHA